MAGQHSISFGVLSIMYMLISNLYWPQVNGRYATTGSTEFTTTSLSSTTTDGFSDTGVITSGSLGTSSSISSFQAMQSTLNRAKSFKKPANFQTPASLYETTDTTTFSTSRCTTKRPVKKPCLTKNKVFWQKLRIEIIVGAGYAKEIYLTQNGVPHFGIAHKITKQDPEFFSPVGTKVGRKRIEEAYHSDMKTVIQSCCRFFKDFQNLPEVVQLIILNMRFNLGHAGLISFVKFRNAINSRDWKKAANEMEKSRWYKKLTNRAKRLVDRMKSVSQDSDC